MKEEGREFRIAKKGFILILLDYYIYLRLFGKIHFHRSRSSYALRIWAGRLSARIEWRKANFEWRKK